MLDDLIDKVKLEMQLLKLRWSVLRVSNLTPNDIAWNSLKREREQRLKKRSYVTYIVTQLEPYLLLVGGASIVFGPAFMRMVPSSLYVFFWLIQICAISIGISSWLLYRDYDRKYFEVTEASITFFNKLEGMLKSFHTQGAEELKHEEDKPQNNQP